MPESISWVFCLFTDVKILTLKIVNKRYPKRKYITGCDLSLKIGRAANKKQQMEKKIYEAGMSLFREKGFTNTTLQEISEKAGVSKGTIFNYFASKEDILTRFGKQSIIRLQAFANELPPSMITRDKIIAVLLEDIRGVKESEVYAQVTLRGLSEGGNTVFKLESKNRQDLSEIYENILMSGQKAGNNSKMNVSLIADLIVGIYFHILEGYYIFDKTIYDIEDYIKEAVEMIFNGIKDFFDE